MDFFFCYGACPLRPSLTFSVALRKRIATMTGHREASRGTGSAEDPCRTVNDTHTRNVGEGVERKGESVRGTARMNASASYIPYSPIPLSYP